MAHKKKAHKAKMAEGSHSHKEHHSAKQMDVHKDKMKKHHSPRGK